MKYNYNFELGSEVPISKVAELIPENSKVFEIGTAHGLLAKYLSEVKCCELYGIEIDRKSVELSAPYFEKIYCTNVEDYVSWYVDFAYQTYDAIVLTDVIEHLLNPKLLLTVLKKLLKPEGRIYISIPNVSHNSIIMMLLDDEFSYNETGLLDNTHLRFFTRKSFISLSESLGFHLEYETAIYKRPESTEFNYSYEDFEVSKYLLSRDSGEVYQYIFSLTKSDCGSFSDYKYRDQATLYYDTGNGFSDSEKKVILHNGDTIDFQFSLDDIKDIQAVRFDVSEYPIKIEIESFKLNGIETCKFLTNGLDIDGCIYFRELDPQILFIDSDNVISVNIKLKSISYIV